MIVNKMKKSIRKIQSLIGNKYALKFIEKITGTIILRKLPLGIDSFLDISYHFHNYEIKSIIDVGANIGQSENSFVKKTNATIYCIEPVSETFNCLLKNVKSKNTKCFQIAVGEVAGTIQMKINLKSSFSVSNSILNKEEFINLTDFAIENVDMKTLDVFAEEQNISHLNLLKIDSEGYDLNVLKGATNLLSQGKIDFLEVEVSMNPFNTFHVNYIDIYNYLQDKNYFVFGIYEQIHDFVLNKPIVRRCNVLFISKNMMDSYSNQF